MYILTYDVGTSNVKTCLFEIASEIRLAEGAAASYGLYITENGGAEQDAEEWWTALCTTTREVLRKSEVEPRDIRGLAFCSQMQGAVFVDEDGNSLRRPMSYMDQRGVREFKDCMGGGLIKVAGCNAVKIARNVLANYAAPISVKDPIWKYKWVENNEPELFRKIHKWLDVGDYLTSRCTGSFVRTHDSAFATFLYDTRKGKEGWNRGLLDMYGVKPEHMPEIVACTDPVGGLTKKAAEELGLAEGTPVYGGGGDVTFVNIGAGCTIPGDTHIYVGTSGWVSTFMDHQTVDAKASITGIPSAKRGYYNYLAEMETAGKCFEWVMDHLALDEVGVYLSPKKISDVESKYRSLYDYLSEEVSRVPPGANGVIFTPWLHGNRCPFEDANAGGMFFNIRIENGKRDMIRAVLEGICYHLRWMLECEARKVKTSDPIRFVGGGALSPITCQMLADITGRMVETIDKPQSVGAIGAALTVAAGVTGADVLELSHRLVKANRSYAPDPRNREIYDRNYSVFKKLYKDNASHFRALNA